MSTSIGFDGDQAKRMGLCCSTECFSRDGDVSSKLKRVDQFLVFSDKKVCKSSSVFLLILTDSLDREWATIGMASALSLIADLAFWTSVVTSSAMTGVVERVDATPASAICASFTANAASVFASLGVGTGHSTASAVLIAGLGIDASVGAGLGGWVAAQYALAFVAKLGGCTCFATFSAVLTIGLEVSATASAGGAFIWASAHARLAEKSCTTGFSATSAVTGVLLDIKTSPITGCIGHRRARLHATSVGTDFSRFAGVVTSAAMQTIDFWVDTRSVTQEQSARTRAVSGITDLACLACFAATAAMTGVGLRIDTSTKASAGG